MRAAGTRRSGLQMGETASIRIAASRCGAARRARAAALAFAALGCAFGLRAADEPAAWQVVGHQGLVQIVIAPQAQSTDPAAYRAQIGRLCPPDRTCFINFFTNTSGAPAVLPLPDAIAAEATARFRRSTKNGVEIIQWSCRLGLAEGECF